MEKLRPNLFWMSERESRHQLQNKPEKLYKDGPNSRCNHEGVFPANIVQEDPLFTPKKRLFARG